MKRVSECLNLREGKRGGWGVGVVAMHYSGVRQDFSLWDLMNGTGGKMRDSVYG